jgi:hypothetical protein
MRALWWIYDRKRFEKIVVAEQTPTKPARKALGRGKR